MIVGLTAICSNRVGCIVRSAVRPVSDVYRRGARDKGEGHLKRGAH